MKKRQNHKQVIKNAGYSLFRVETAKYKGLFGGTCNHVIGLQDKEGKTYEFTVTEILENGVEVKGWLYED